MVHYVGASVVGLIRPKSHRRYGNRRGKRGSPQNPKNCWLNDLIEGASLDYEIVVLEEVPEPNVRDPSPCWKNHARNPSRINEAERWWIALGRAFGWPLTNDTDGGEGTRGRKHREDACKVIGEKQARSWAVPGAREVKIAALKRANNAPEVLAANRARALKQFAEKGHPSLGSKYSDEARANVAAGALRRWTTPEALEFMRGPGNPSRSPEARAKISAARKAIIHPPPPHGTMRAYNYAIRRRAAGVENCGPCDLCMDASATYARNRRHAKKK